MDKPRVYTKIHNMNERIDWSDPTVQDLCDANDGLSRLLQHAGAAVEALREFCDRVERGEVMSRYTYEKFKAILEDYDRG